MDRNRIYKIVNEVLDSYATAGVGVEDLLSYLNEAEENYENMYNRAYRRLTMEEVQFESDVLKDCLKDSIRDRVAVLNDVSKK